MRGDSGFESKSFLLLIVFKPVTLLIELRFVSNVENENFKQSNQFETASIFTRFFEIAFRILKCVLISSK